MDACVRHLRVPKDTPTGRASFLLIQDTLQTLGQQAIFCEVTSVLLLLEVVVTTVVNACHLFAGHRSVAVVCCTKPTSVHAGIGFGL